MREARVRKKITKPFEAAVWERARCFDGRCGALKNIFKLAQKREILI